MARLLFGIVLALTAAAGLVLFHERHRWHERLSPLWVTTVHDVPYGPHPENRLDILRNRWRSCKSECPAVIVFHGGGWRNGNREDMLVRACHRYLEHGFVVANVEYRLGDVSAAVEDADLALQWFLRHASEYGADRSRVVVTGESAGAHLALMAAFQSKDRVAAVVNFYGVSNLADMLDRPAIRAAFPRGNPKQLAEALSPVTHVRTGLPPVFSIHGTADDIVPPEQTALLTRTIRAAGGEAFEFYVNGGKHGFSSGNLDTAYAAVFDFLRKRGILKPNE